MTKLTSFLSSLFIFLFFLITPILADEEIRHLSLDLKAKGFTQSTWYDNLDSSNIIFAPNDHFQLQLTITNTGNRNQTTIRVTPTNPATIYPFDSFTLNQLPPNQSYVKNYTVSIKNSPFLYRSLKASTIRFDLNTDVGTKTGDYLTFFTAGGTKALAASTATSSVLPATGFASLVFASLIVLAAGLLALFLRRLARGY